MKYRHHGNTFFHDCIANDDTKYALCLLKFIDEIAKENGISKQLNKLIPFTEFENGDKTNTYVSDIKKNFLMLAIAKKYDNSKIDIQNNVTENTVSNLEQSIKNRAEVLSVVKSSKTFNEENLKKLEYDFSIEDALDKDKIKKIKTFGPSPKCNHKDKYQKDDSELTHWLIDKAPTECLQQKDSAGYNLADYALMKMDSEILEHLLQKEPELLEGSKLYNDVLSGKFSYEEAAQKVAERYGATIAIADENEWNSKKEEIRKFLQERNNVKPVNNKKIEKKEKEKSNGIG